MAETPVPEPQSTNTSARVALLLFVVLAVIVAAIVGVLALRGQPAPSLVAAGSAAAPPSSSLAPQATTTPGATMAATATVLQETAGPSLTLGITPPPASELPSPSSTAPATSPPPTPLPSPTSTIPVDATLDAALGRCPTAAEVALVDSRLTMTFADDPIGGKRVCRARDGSADLTYFQERAYQAVLSMRRIKFDAPLPWTDRSFFGWFTHAVTGIEFREVEFSHCCDGDRVIVIKSSVINEYDRDWVKRDQSACGGCGLITLPGLLAHEARHAEGYPHTCGNDDQTFDEMGAWAVNYLYYVWLAKHATGDYMKPVDAPADLYTTAAAKLSEIYLDRFCEPFSPWL